MGQSSSASRSRRGIGADVLRRQAELLESAFQNLGEGIAVLDDTGAVLLVTAEAERLLRLAPGASPAAVLPYARVAGGETLERFEIPGCDVLVSARPLCDRSGAPCGALFILREGQNRKPAEALRDYRELAAAVVETAACLVIVLDREGRVVSFNRACEQTTGWNFDELRDKPIWDVLLRPEEVEPVKAVFADLRAGRFPNRYDNYWIARNGRRRLISWSNTALLDEAGNVQYVVGTGIDITERKRVEDELRQANDTLRAVIQASPLAIIGMDLRGRVHSWNHAAERMFGWTEQEVCGRFLPIVPDEDRETFEEHLERSRSGETLSGIEQPRRRKDGSLVDTATWTAVQRSAAGMITGVMAVLADMTERRRLEEQFRQSQKMEAVGRLAGGVAHDFNNLLTVITGYTQMMVDGMEPDDPVRSNLEEVLRASESAAALTNQLLAFSRRQIVQPQVLDLNSLLAGMDKMLHRLIGEDVELVMMLAPKLARVKVDPGQFQQVLMNLVVNARDAMPEGGRLTIETAAADFPSGCSPAPPGLAPGSYVMLAVSDTGRGMDEETRRRLFEPFFTTKARGKGTGLGLSTAYGIVKQAGGEIFAESELGKGATFRIYVPAIEVAVAAGVRGPASLARPQAGTETVLLVEDEAGLRKLIREVLRNNGYLVLQAGDVREALRLCEQHLGPIHLFLTDVVMPHMSGRELADRVRALRPDMKVLYMSGYTEHVILDQGLREPDLAFLQKPFTPEALLAKVRNTLDTK